jgi:hypothetical protein
MTLLRAICNGLPKSMKTSQLTSYFQLIVQLEDEKETVISSTGGITQNMERTCIKLEEVFK